MSALPKTDSPQVQDMTKEDDDYLSAYNVCLQYEASATNANQLRHVRILGFLLLNAPSSGIRSEVTNCIHSRKDDAGLFDLGVCFERHFIVPCEFSACHSIPYVPIFVSSVKRYKGRTPKSSDHPSRPSFEVARGQIEVDIKEAPKDHKGAKDRVRKRLSSSSFKLFLIPHLKGSHSRQLEMCRDEYCSL